MAHAPTFVARQPILDAGRRVFGYELLFRATSSSEACDGTAEVASASVISSAVLDLGLDALTQGRRAFVNVTRKMLVDGVPEVLPPGRVVLELTEDIDPDDEVLEACERLRYAGYALALDDFVLTDRTASLVPYANFVKVDFLASSAEARARIAALCAAAGPVLLAEKIETVEAFETARAEGHMYFQGFFFGRPVVQVGRSLPGQQIHSLRLLSALQNPHLSAQQIEELVKPDMRLCYFLLRTVNSAGFALRSTVRSIRDALVLIGHDAVRRWASLWLMAGLGDAGHPELVAMSATRARCCELVAARVAGGDSADAFLVGMCSLLDAILARPMREVVDHLPLADSTRAALLGEANTTRRLLDCAVAYERGDWATCEALARSLGVDPACLPDVHAEALRWAHQLHTVGSAH